MGSGEASIHVYIVGWKDIVGQWFRITERGGRRLQAVFADHW
jgi:hypothetical protein